MSSSAIIKIEESPQLLFSKKSLEYSKKKKHNKIGPLIKLQLINALDNGQCKMEIAKKFSVNPQTLSSIYRKKECIIHKYTQTYSTLVEDSQSVNLDKLLLDWFKLETQNGNIISQEQLQTKTLHILRSLIEEPSPICTKDWLHNFRLRHNIITYKSKIICSQPATEEWLMLLNRENVNNVYVGAVCSLTYRHDLKKYANGEDIDTSACLLLVTNVAGTDKKQLAVVGSEILDENVSSLPFYYYNGPEPQMNNFVLTNYLKKWDIELKAQNRSIVLLLNVPINFIPNTEFENISILNLINFMYALKASEKIVECFKFHYRKLLINKTVIQNYETRHLTIMDYVHLMSIAWHYVSYRYIRLLYSPLEDGSLFFKIDSGDDGDHSLTKWYKEYNIDLDINISQTTLDKYIMCDEKIPCFNLEQANKYVLNTREAILAENTEPASALEAYQAMRRLLSYVQGEGADDVLLQHVKLLEEHLEYSTMLQLHQITASSTN